MKTLLRSALIASGAWLAACTPAHAQYPVKPIRLIVPFAAGSTNDIVARLISTPMAEALGRQIVIDNRAGAAGNIGAELAAVGVAALLFDVDQHKQEARVPFVRVVARRFLADAGAIEDAVQETLLSVHRMRHTYEPGRPVEPWIAAIVGIGRASMRSNTCCPVRTSR